MPTSRPGGVHMAPDTARQVATFQVDGLWFGVDVLHVQEVIRWQPLTRVPFAPGAVQGLINLRGQIVAAVDLRRRLGLDGRGHGELPINLVVHTTAGVVSLLVDEVGDVLEVDRAAYEPMPGTLAEPIREVVTGVYKLPASLLLVFDVDQAVAPMLSDSRFD